MIPGKAVELLVDGFDQLLLVVDVAAPGFVVVGLQADVELAVEEAGGVGAVVGTAQFGADDRDLRIRHQDVADLRGDLAGLFEGDGVGHGRAHPQRAFVEVRHELAADEGDQQQRARRR